MIKKSLGRQNERNITKDAKMVRLGSQEASWNFMANKRWVCTVHDRKSGTPIKSPLMSTPVRSGASQMMEQGNVIKTVDATLR